MHCATITRKPKPPAPPNPSSIGSTKSASWLFRPPMIGSCSAVASVKLRTLERGLSLGGSGTAAEADWHNNFAERQIRPAAILRKNIQCNRSERGAATQAVLMSVYRTLKLRGHDPRAAIKANLCQWSATGTLPPLPELAVGGG